MVQPYRVIDGDDPGRNLGGWDDQGNVDIPGTLVVNTIQGSGSSTPSLTTVTFLAQVEFLAGVVLAGITAMNLEGAAASDDVFTTRVTGNAFPRFSIDADGKLGWGPGTGAVDITLSRYAVGGLEISGALRFTNGQLLFGPAGDVNLYWGGAGVLKTDDYLQLATGQSDGDFSVYGTNLTLGTAGGGLRVKEGANARMGTVTLAAGTATVNTTAVTANSRIFLTAQTSGAAPGALRVSARVAGTSFTITSTSGTDTSSVAWMIVEPAP